MNQNGDRPDFVVKDKDGHKIGLEHFRADVYRVQDERRITMQIAETKESGCVI